jgi:light-regulated signal transduction histidine kinase (bacteriophytochrome)
VADIERLNGQLERSNAVLDGFASRAAEDLLEPLDTIAGFLELLGARHPDRLGSEGELLVRRATELANAQRRRIAALLDYAEAGSVTVEIEPVDLSSAIEEACARAGRALGGASVRIAGGSSTVVPGDQRQLVRLLELLIDRSVRRANASRVTVAAEREGAGARVVVVDDGKLLSTEETTGMFDGNASTVMDDPDAVSLVVARRIVERHGGTIWAEPGRDGIGTTVTFTLPDQRAA